MAKAKKTKSKRIKLNIWWIIAPVVFVALIIFYGFSQKTTPQPEESSRYVTYRDSDFSIEYPQSWDVKKDTQIFEKGDIVAFQVKGPTQKRYTEFIDGARFIVSKPFSINANLETWIKDYFKGSVKFSKSEFSRHTYEEVEDCTNSYTGCMKYFFTTVNNKVYGVALFAEGGTEEKAMYENALIHMFKSLKFTNDSADQITKEEAISKVKALPEVIDYLKRVPNGLVLINGEENDSYMVQVYEFKNGHTATFNWYKVNKTTGEIKKEF